MSDQAHGYADWDVGSWHKTSRPVDREVLRIGAFRLVTQPEQAKRWSTPYLEWMVELPHQCDEWVIGHGATVSEVAVHLERFIADATTMLEQMRQIARGE